MARIRTIKPEFFTSEDVVALSPLARLLFIAMWCESDREGRMDWKPATFKLRYLPGDNCDIDQLCQEIVDQGLVIPYEVGGKKYAEIPSFPRHQVINNRETESAIPSRVAHASGTRQARVSDASCGKGKEGKGREGKTRAVSLPSDFTPNDRNRELAGELNISLPTELGKFTDYHKAKGSTFKDWHAALNNWLRNAKEFQGGKSQPQPQGANLKEFTG
jgi:hypothetical protein